MLRQHLNLAALAVLITSWPGVTAFPALPIPTTVTRFLTDRSAIPPTDDFALVSLSVHEQTGINVVKERSTTTSSSNSSIFFIFTDANVGPSAPCTITWSPEDGQQPPLNIVTACLFDPTKTVTLRQWHGPSNFTMDIVHTVSADGTRSANLTGATWDPTNPGGINTLFNSSGTSAAAATNAEASSAVHSGVSISGSSTTSSVSGLPQSTNPAASTSSSKSLSLDTAGQIRKGTFIVSPQNTTDEWTCTAGTCHVGSNSLGYFELSWNLTSMAGAFPGKNVSDTGLAVDAYSQKLTLANSTVPA